jgi:hypothetical protein
MTGKMSTSRIRVRQGASSEKPRREIDASSLRVVGAAGCFHVAFDSFTFRNCENLKCQCGRRERRISGEELSAMNFELLNDLTCWNCVSAFNPLTWTGEL